MLLTIVGLFLIIGVGFSWYLIEQVPLQLLAVINAIYPAAITASQSAFITNYCWFLPFFILIGGVYAVIVDTIRTRQEGWI